MVLLLKLHFDVSLVTMLKMLRDQLWKSFTVIDFTVYLYHDYDRTFFKLHDKNNIAFKQLFN